MSPRVLPAFVLLLAASLALVALPTSVAQADDNAGTVKVHDDETENPVTRNVPHVDCDFWIEITNLQDPSGFLVFYAWPPTGDKSEVAPTGASVFFNATETNAHGNFHINLGPYSLPTGHYRVEVYTYDGHPGNAEQFAKTKTFWVVCEEIPPVPLPCPVIVSVTATSEGGVNQVLLDWTAVVGAESYVVYRADSGGDFEFVASVEGDVSVFADDDTTPGVTYEYYVTAVLGGVESEVCASVEVTAVPFFPGGALVGGAVLVAGVGAFAWLRRRS